MERSLLAGDAVLVSKLHYGPRTPSTINLPFLDGEMFSSIRLPSFRLPGFSSVQRGDVVVFRYPQEDGPVDRKTHYVKRAVGLPGDTLAIKDKVPYINGRATPMGKNVQQHWVARLRKGAKVISDSLRAVGATPVASELLEHAGRITFEATRSIASTVEAWEEVDEVSMLVHGDTRRSWASFPEGRGYSLDNYGPIYVPAEGDTISLTRGSWTAYRQVIAEYEGHDVERLDDGFLIDGQETKQYVFEQDYYFVLGDNRDNSSDSRVWGFVPANHLVGKVVMVYFSWNKKREHPRYSRIMLPVD